MLLILIILAVVAAIYGPGLWANHVLARHNREEYFSGTGYDLARLILDRAGLTHITVESTALGDHYDPEAGAVRLNPRYCGRRSLSAVVVAAHEVGHALQHAAGYRPLTVRTRLLITARNLERIGIGIIMAAPVITALTRVPASGVLVFIGGVLGLGMPLLVHLITLPVEFDAGFNRALPCLSRQRLVPPEDLSPARTILTACAITYVAQALAGLLNIWRWLRVLRR
ncbi:zinc metallopeptidase [Desulfatiferula olefinivorans]